jgi:crossover junction endodeoxyribonuclease RuvC
VKIFMGIDIGACGAIALLDEGGGLVGVEDMPVLADGPKERRAPGEGAVGAFAFGRSRGVVEGVLGGQCAATVLYHI